MLKQLTQAINPILFDGACGQIAAGFDEIEETCNAHVVVAVAIAKREAEPFSS